MPKDPLGILTPKKDTGSAEVDPLGILKKKSGTEDGSVDASTGGTPIFSQYTSSSDRQSGFATAGGNTKPTTVALTPTEIPNRVPDPSFSNMLNQPNVLDHDIAANNVFTLSSYNNKPQDPASLQGFNQNQQSLAAGSLVPSYSEESTHKAAEIKNNPDALKDYRKTRMQDIDGQISELEATKQPTVGYLETGQRISQEPQPVDDQIKQLKDYKEQLQKSVAEAALISVPKQVYAAGKDINVEEVGKKYLETIGDPTVSDDEKTLSGLSSLSTKGQTETISAGTGAPGVVVNKEDNSSQINLTSETIKNKLFKSGAAALSAYHLKAATDLMDNPLVIDYNNAVTSLKQIGKSSEEGLYPNADPKKYETKLSPEEDAKFQKWLDDYHSQGKIPNGDYKFYKENGYGYDYDFRAAYVAGVVPEINKQDGKWHWNDLGKKPNEPTFSNQSKYNKVDGLIGGRWDEDNFIRPTSEIEATAKELSNNPDVVNYANSAKQALHYDNEAKTSSKYYPQVARQELRQTLNDKFFDLVTKRDESSNKLSLITPVQLALQAALGETPSEEDITKLAKETGKPVEEVRSIVNTPVTGLFGTAPQGVRVTGLATGISEGMDETLANSLNGMRRFFNVPNVNAKNALLQTRSDAYNMSANQNSLQDKQGNLNFNPYSITNMAGRGVGQMAIFALPTMVTGGFAEGLVAPEIAAAAKEGTNSFLATATTKSAEGLTTLATGYIGSYEPAYKDISTYTADEQTRRSYANAIALENAAPELIYSPADIAKNMGLGELSKDALIKNFVNTAKKDGVEAAFSQRLKAAAKTFGEEHLAENLEEQYTNLMTNKTDEQYMGKVKTAKELADQFVSTVASTSISLAPMSIGGGMGAFHDAGGLRRHSFFEAGVQKDETLAKLGEMHKAGLLDDNNYNTRVSIVNQMANIVANLPTENIHGQPLDYEQKTKLAAAQYRIDLNKKLQEKSNNEGAVAAQADLIKEDTQNAVNEQKDILTAPIVKGEPENISQPIELNPEITSATSTVVPKPTEQQIANDIKNKDFASFTFKSMDEVPDELKNRVSSSGETNGEPFVKVTLPKSEFDYYSQPNNPNGENQTATTTGSATSEANNTTQEGKALEGDASATPQETSTKAQAELADSQIKPTFKGVVATAKKEDAYEVPSPEADKVKGVIDRIGNADYINENDINGAVNVLYDVWDKSPNSRHLIEPLINKLENYEFTTTTKTSNVTETVPVEVARNAKPKEVTPALEQSAGSPVTVTSPFGAITEGTLAVKDGRYVLQSEGENDVVIGDKTVTDVNLKMPSEEQMPNPIEFDENGAVSAVTFQTPKGDLVRVENPETALDLAIQLRAEAVGHVEEPLFDTVFKQVQKEVKEEVLKNKPNESQAAEKPVIKTDEPIAGNNEPIASEKISPIEATTSQDKQGAKQENSVTTNTNNDASVSSEVPKQEVPKSSSEQEHARTSQEQNKKTQKTNDSNSPVGSKGKQKEKIKRTKASEVLRSVADRAEKGILPSWAKATLPDGTQQQGFGEKELSAAIAKALRITADAIDKGAQLAGAVNDGFNDLLNYYKSNNVSVDEAALRNGFEQEVRSNLNKAKVKQQQATANKTVNKSANRSYANFTVRMADLLNSDKTITPEQIIATLGKVTDEQKKIIYEQYEKRRSKEEAGLAATKKWVGDLFDALANGTNISKSAFNIAKSDYAHVLDLVADKFIEYKVVSNRKLEKFADKAIELFKDDYAGAIDYVEKADKLGEAKPILLAKLAVKLDEAGKGKDAAKVMQKLIATATFTARTLQSFQRVNEILNVKGSPQYKTELAKRVMEKAKEMSDARVHEVEEDFSRQLKGNQAEIQKYKDQLDAVRNKAHKSTLSSIRERMDELVNKICNVRRK